MGYSWRMDQTNIKVGGKDRCLYRAVDKDGNTLDFLLKREGKGCQHKSSSLKPLVIMKNLE